MVGEGAGVGGGGKAGAGRDGELSRAGAGLSGGGECPGEGRGVAGVGNTGERTDGHRLQVCLQLALHETRSTAISVLLASNNRDTVHPACDAGSSSKYLR